MLRAIGVLFLALIVWMVVATAGHRLMFVVWPAYAEATPLFSFTLAMKVFRLSLGAVSTLAAAAVARRLSAAPWLPVALGCLLVALFVPQHYFLWSRFPVWYHVTFLASLIPLTVLGARIVPVRQAGTSA